MNGSRRRCCPCCGRQTDSSPMPPARSMAATRSPSCGNQRRPIAPGLLLTSFPPCRRGPADHDDPPDHHDRDPRLMSAGAVLPPGAGRRTAGGSLDATVKMTMDYPASTSTFEVVIGPGFDVGA